VAERPLLIAGATRPCTGESVNGDGYLVTWRDGRCRLAVVDGLGHGHAASEAEQAARRALEAAPEADAAASRELCSRALSRTRGAAITIVSVDWQQRHMTFAGIGNVEGRLLLPERERRLAPQRGIVGTSQRSLRLTQIELPDSWLLVLHSDGVSGRFELTDLRAELGSDPEALAQRLVDGWGRERDDATALVACPAPGSAS
jgi:serine/threonine protein phosphatase PrpC